jgi:hypothetical protein
MPVQHGQQHRQPVLLRPTDRRRGLGLWALSTSAWISTSSGRVPSWVTSTQEPGTC